MNCNMAISLFQECEKDKINLTINTHHYITKSEDAFINR